jgi:hypothetical protein
MLLLLFFMCMKIVVCNVLLKIANSGYKKIISGVVKEEAFYNC